MADTKISALTDGTTANGTDAIPVARAGANNYITPAYLATYFRGLANTFTTTQTITPGTEVSPLVLTGGTLAGATSRPLIDATQTWNNAGTTFTALKLNVTSTASAAASLLEDIQVAGTSYYKLDKTGALTLSQNVAHLFGSSSQNVKVDPSNIEFQATQSSALAAGFGAYGAYLKSDICLSWSSSATNSKSGIDLYLCRDAAATLAQRNSTNAQALRIYRTYTDSSNYQRISQTWNTSTALIMNEGAGTGADGNIAFNDAALATNATKGYIMIPSCAGAPTGVPADIPTGQVALHFDTTNNKLYVYDAGWLSTAALT